VRLCQHIDGLLQHQFNITNSLLDPPSPTAPALLHRDLLQDLQNGANSLVAVAATKVSDAAGHVESALSSAVAAVPKLQQIEDYVPLNCTFGLKRFCVGYLHAQDLSCSDSPFDISALLPDTIQDLPAPLEAAFRERIGDLSPLADHLSRLPTSVLTCLLIGICSTILALGVFCYLAKVSYGQQAGTARKLGRVWRIVIHLIMATVCCTPYLTLILLQHTVIEEARGIHDWVEVKEGAIFGLSIGLFVCTVIFVALSAICVALPDIFSSPSIVPGKTGDTGVRKRIPLYSNYKSTIT
jgi:hypothetical protein